MEEDNYLITIYCLRFLKGHLKSFHAPFKKKIIEYALSAQSKIQTGHALKSSLLYMSEDIAERLEHHEKLYDEQEAELGRRHTDLPIWLFCVGVVNMCKN